MSTYKKETDSSTELHFKDAVFKQAIKDLFNLDDSMTKEDLAKIEELVLYYGDTETGPMKLNGKITGLEDLQYFPHLKRLVLNSSDPDNSEIYGELKDVVHLKQLTVLDLDGVVLKCDISELHTLTQLTEIMLSGEGITGDLDSLNCDRFKKLKKLSICDTEVTGNIASMKDLTELEELAIYGSKITGDISALKNVKKLRELDICDTEITGDISFLRDFEMLRYLDVYESNVSYTDDLIKALEENGVVVETDEEDEFDDDEYEDEYNEYDEYDDTIFMDTLYLTGEAETEYFEITRISDDEAFVHYGIIGETGSVEKITWSEKTEQKLLEERIMEGFAPATDDDLFALPVTIKDYPCDDPDALIDEMEIQLAEYCVGVVHSADIINDTLKLCCAVIDVEIVKKVLTEHFDEYEIVFE